jgi:hypothetical protein
MTKRSREFIRIAINQIISTVCRDEPKITPGEVLDAVAEHVEKECQRRLQYEKLKMPE